MTTLSEAQSMVSFGGARTSSPIAALQGASSADIQAFLADFAVQAARDGCRIAGVIEVAAARATGVCGRLAVRDLSTGAVISISQDLGVGSKACNLDASGLAEACAAVERAIAAGTDLVILSKFGKLEAARSGLSDAFRAAIGAELPILTSVSPAMSEAWRRFAGPLSQFLPTDRGIIDVWWSLARSGRRSQDSIAGGPMVPVRDMILRF